VFADVTHTIQVDQLERTYTVHEPAKHKKTLSMPVVLIFHGGGSNAKAIARYTKMNDKADEAGFMAVYPSGTGRLKRILTWNGGDCCGYAQRQGVDDVKFVAAMLDDLAKRYNIDQQRVYATGMSNGAMISYRIAAELADRIAAIAPVGAAMAIDDPKPTRPVPVMHFHGTADEFAPYDGGRGKFTVSRFQHHRVDDCIAKWLMINRCQTKPLVRQLADIDKDDGCTVLRKSYRARKGGAPVVVYVIQGGGHNWPGRPPVHQASTRLDRKAKMDFGASTRDIDANDEMWQFFQKFTLLSR
jgi:polyhydroxybutyrate depolymerase